jgi:TctA family transporter
MARQGRPGPALAIAAIGSFFAGTVATILIAVAAPPLTKVAQQFTPADYCSLMVLGLVPVLTRVQVQALRLARGRLIPMAEMAIRADRRWTMDWSLHT